METKPTLAIIGGSGLYAMPGLTEVKELDVTTPFGKPSSPLVVGNLEGRSVAFLARHGFGHSISPSEINYRANIYALKQIGVERIVSISACGSLREDYAPGEIVIPDNLFDFTRNRRRTFFDDGMVAHVSAADPFCPQLSSEVVSAVEVTGARVHVGGSLIVIEGPRFSTKAESNVFRSWGMSLIGMTAAPEAFLAREAEICYSTMAHVTDYDVWHVTAEPVTVERVIEILNRNTEVAQVAVRNLLHSLPEERACSCGSAMQNAVITSPDRIPAETRKRLDLLIGPYLKK